MSDTPPIPGFTRHGNNWRAQVIVDEATARDVAREAADRHASAAQVMRERIVKGAKPAPELRRCAALGCQARRSYPWNEADGWYKMVAGFMSHACPVHRAAFEAYDQAERERRLAWGRYCQGAIGEDPESLRAEFDLAYAAPSLPPMQPSLLR